MRRLYRIQRQPLGEDLFGPWHTVLIVCDRERANRMLTYMVDRYPEYHWQWSAVSFGA